MTLAAYSVEEVSSFLLKKGFPSDLIGNLSCKSINIDTIFVMLIENSIDSPLLISLVNDFECHFLVKLSGLRMKLKKLVEETLEDTALSPSTYQETSTLDSPAAGMSP